MVALTDSMIETRNDIRRLYEAWPEQMRAVTRAVEDVRRRSSETDAAMVSELQNIYTRLDEVIRKLS
jgi:hypothetical protein